MKAFLLLPVLLLAPLVSLHADNSAIVTPPPAVTTPAPAIDPAKEAEVRKMIEKSGVKKTMKQTMDRMFDTFKERNTKLPADFWPKIESEMDTDDLVEKLIPIYAQYYSLDDLKAINAFYDSPAGQHMVATQPQVIAAAMQVGQQWAQGLSLKVMDEIREEQAKSPAPAPAAPTPYPATDK